MSLQAAVTNRPDANLTALLVDYGTGTPVIVTRGWLDPQNRTGADVTTPLTQGTEYTLRFDMQPKDHVFAAGRRIGLVVISTDSEFTLRPLGGTGLRLAPGYSSLTVPVVGLNPGTVVFGDDFETDRGWQVNADGTDTATAGRFERANPETTTSGGTIQEGTTPSGSYDLVTGALAGASVGANDLDGGLTSVRSPAITLAAGSSYTLSFACYLAHLNNASGADYLRVRIVHAGGTTTVFTRVGAASQVGAAWTVESVDLTAYAGQSVRILVEANDTDPGSLLEAGVDDVRVLRV
ncbi:CocE/NonD family hydrolase C-terminal non-catalytic domain-containing protein [Longispora sp. NPDC051575]|uniref:CocE/NonD family hydrolase C-terminal non-catalytic domain-containing protein n=1 Tax=Longispora sp. NPDC051575 TaxID=3154943 RepID=UPI003440B309